MDTYTAVKNRILQLLGEKSMSIHRLDMESAEPPHQLKTFFTERAKIPES